MKASRDRLVLIVSSLAGLSQGRSSVRSGGQAGPTGETASERTKSQGTIFSV